MTMAVPGSNRTLVVVAEALVCEGRSTVREFGGEDPVADIQPEQGLGFEPLAGVGAPDAQHRLAEHGGLTGEGAVGRPDLEVRRDLRGAQVHSVARRGEPDRQAIVLEARSRSQLRAEVFPVGREVREARSAAIDRRQGAVFLDEEPCHGGERSEAHPHPALDGAQHALGGPHADLRAGRVDDDHAIAFRVGAHDRRFEEDARFRGFGELVGRFGGPCRDAVVGGRHVAAAAGDGQGDDQRQRGVRGPRDRQPFVKVFRRCHDCSSRRGGGVDVNS